MKTAVGRLAFASVLARGVVSQAILSAGSFAVSLILLRDGSNAQYGYYVLVFNAVMLITSLQGAFVGPALVNELKRLDPRGRTDLIGGLYGGQRRMLLRVVPVCVCGILTLRLFDVIDTAMTWILLVATGSAWGALYRQFFRMVSNAHRDSSAALLGDVTYVVVLICGAAIGVSTSVPAIVTLVFMGLGALAGGLVNSRLAWARERWNVNAVSRVWRDIAAVGVWTGAGSAAHWGLNQGYNYLIVGTLNVAAIAAIGSARTMMMPVGLLSAGVSSLMLPTVYAWLPEHGVSGTVRRVTLSAAAISGLALLYLALFWPMRDFVFSHILHKQFAQRDLMLLLWSAVSVVTVARDQFVNFFLARTRYQSMTGITLVSAIVSLTVGYIMLFRIGAAGGVLGVLVGELINVMALIVMSRLEVRRDVARLMPANSP